MIKKVLVILLILTGGGVLALHTYKKASANSASPVETLALSKESPSLEVKLGSGPTPVLLYFAPSCGHCEAFILDELNPLISTGKFNFTLRIIPLNYLDTPAAAIAWSKGPDHFLEIMKEIMQRQKEWMIESPEKEDPLLPLKTVCESLKTGLSKKEVDAAIADKKVEEALLETSLKATNAKGEPVTFAPVFYINNSKEPATQEEIDVLLQSLPKSETPPTAAIQTNTANPASQPSDQPTHEAKAAHKHD
jgi:protein-disulfide isomerase